MAIFGFIAHVNTYMLTCNYFFGTMKYFC